MRAIDVGLDDALEADRRRCRSCARLREDLIDGVEVVERVQETLAEQRDDGDGEHHEHADRAATTRAPRRGRRDRGEVEARRQSRRRPRHQIDSA